MTSKRPRLKIPFEGFDIILECCSISLLCLMWLYVFKIYGELPETVSTHFNAQGIADGFSNKSTLWFIPIIATLLYVCLIILNKFPHLHKYKVNITETNAYKNYRFSTRILRVVNLLSITLMAYITYFIVGQAKDKEIEISSLFLPLVIGLSIILPIVILIYQRKLNKD